MEVLFMRNKKFSFSVNGKGYYIALILCAVAIGISGYLYYRNTTNDPDNSLQSNASVNDPATPGDVQAAATTPGTTQPGTTVPNPTTGTNKPGKITRPVSGDTVLDYAMETLCYNPTTRDWRVHNGIDIAAEAGAKVCAAADGTVYTVYEDETMGMTVVIRHDGGYITKYSSLAEEVTVSAGQTVTAGETIGTVGCTALLETAIGDHVHFSVTCNGADIDPNEFLEMS